MTLNDVLATIQPGATFAVRPGTLGLSDEHFHLLARAWLNSGRGEGFSVVKGHVPSDGCSFIDLIILMKDDEV